MKCLNCKCELNDIDKFCYNCGHLSIVGYSYYKNNNKEIGKGKVIRKDVRLNNLMLLTFFLFIVYVLINVVRGKDVFKPIFYIKNEIYSYIYGYKTTIIKTDNVYNNVVINNIEDANNMVRNDFTKQELECDTDIETSRMEAYLEKKYDIISVVFCELSSKEALKIKDTFDKMDKLFPGMISGLTNVSITNAKSNSEYIAYFQPMYTFVNSNSDGNKVNKTQILLNSYYYLNDNILNREINRYVDKNWYVKDATFESAIAHELGHYISFKMYLKSKKLDNVILTTSENNVNNIINEFDQGIYLKDIVKKALDNYNNKYEKKSLEDFTLSISKYAGYKKNGKIVYAETIAEALHDYYLHQDKSSKESLEIIKIIKETYNGMY